ncbi:MULTISPECIES: hypothetical protein [Caballeronia]|jgi:hypothetical protein|uniref:Uncharacterized protein n=1 Tax=Caballeronia zhejiangensis TaxID=871203 RepID=A0A656QB12_9BURK|nr:MULTISPECIES: hypothetical protein [Caballeronia]EKS69654.1 hypothetical protein BURK_016290 [Burkholderia sp. SJ98]KDR25083.1 hypothetical protein BG60_31365 [Caballeronia zhejiangensis]MCG7401061.1 hypothetical protein [Caballeronia zhejiangensis]MCI1046284.1 hypothetical protein [Caballeronia zhejiangensis]MDR5767246.1 hypothetical protein [Caballeronia sp. LZ028]
MNRPDDVIYKGHVLSATAVPEQDRYAAMLIVREPDGTRRSSGMLGEFASETGAVRYAFAYGMAEIDYRQSVQNPR